MRFIVNVIFYLSLGLCTVDCFKNPQVMGNFEHLSLIIGWFLAGIEAKELSNRLFDARG